MVVAIEPNNVPLNKEAILLFASRCKKIVAKHAVEHPVALLVFILLLSSCGLPLVTMISLSPLVLISTCAGYISDLGIDKLLYYLTLQGSSLVFLVVSLSVTTYAAIVGVNLLNSILKSSFVQEKFLKK
ncbi:hypothetical protein HHI36_015967 [Cryptolaemus montrouzieri]|uniref:Uncharacterized protein n=1 Tax=Cryptolaemus montrouzieri TaxID=559131 RepID=A0ABD2N8P9_9CUCU